MRSLARSRLAIALAAVLATVTISGMLPTGSASAKPVYIEDGIQKLRAQNQQLRADLAAYQSAYDELSTGLDRVESQTRRIRDRKTQRAMQRLIDDARDRAAQYIGDDYYDDDDGYGRDDGYGTGHYAISDADLQKIAQRVSAAGYADDQLDVVKAASNVNNFTVEQVVTLMKACTYEDTKIEVAALLYSRIVDPGNWYLVYDGFTYSSSKKTLRERLGQ